MQLSRHAKRRSQQRAIPKDYIEMIMEFGTPIRKPGNAFEYKLHKKNKDRIISHLKHLLSAVDKCTKKAVLVDADNVDDVITVYNCR
jgi:hypothetical protein